MVEGRGRGRQAFGAGVIAALLATLAMALLRLVSGTPSLTETLADVILALLPAPIFAATLDALGHAAKPLLYLCIVLGQLAVGGLLGLVYARMRPGWPSALRIALGLWAVFALVVYPLAGDGLLGSSLSGGRLLTLVLLPAALLVYAAYLVWGVRAPASAASPGPAAPPAEEGGLPRRAFLARVGVGLAAAVIGLGGWAALQPIGGLRGGQPAQPSSDANPTPAVPQTASDGSPAPGSPSALPEFQVPGLSPEVTPNADHYVVSKNFVDPSVDVGSWRLRIDGMVRQPLEFTYEQLRALPQVTGFYTLECISNEVGGDLMSTARWTGVRLADLLQQAGPLDRVVDVELHAADDYVESIPLERALHPDNLIAFEMNGERLPDNHGFPARLLVPGIYGMKNVKWLTRVSLVPVDVKGYWQQRGWSDVAIYKTTSRIDAPAAGKTLTAGQQPVAGVAFGGDRGITRVEVSVDGGKTWQDAKVKPALSPFTWVLWVAPWQAQHGRALLMVRATDGTGQVQTAELHDTLPDGASGYHRVVVNVA